MQALNSKRVNGAESMSNSKFDKYPSASPAKFRNDTKSLKKIPQIGDTYPGRSLSVPYNKSDS
jgi:hypothetical protein